MLHPVLLCTSAHSLLYCLVSELAVRCKFTSVNGTGSMCCHILCPTGSTQKGALREESQQFIHLRPNTIIPKHKDKYNCTHMHNWAAANTSNTANKASCWDKLFANKETLNTVIYTNPQSHALSRVHTNDNKTVESCNAVCLELLWICRSFSIFSILLNL